MEAALAANHTAARDRRKGQLMRTGAGLGLICLGAILAFAVKGNISFMNVHTAGWVIMVVGIAGLVLPRRTYGWLGRRVLVRRTYPGSRLGQEAALPTVMHKPGMWQVTPGLSPRPTLLDDPGADLIDTSASSRIANSTAATTGPPTEVIEEMYEQP
jgi:Domain of unknown function (DUF6458)